MQKSKKTAPAWWISYGENDAFPENVIINIEESRTLYKCVEVYTSFVLGRGIDALKPFYNNVYGKKGDNLYSFIDKIVRDFVIFSGVSIQFHYNIDGKIVGFDHVPFETCRLGRVSDVEKTEDQIFIVSTFDQEARAHLRDLGKYDRYNKFNPLNVKDEILEAGGIDKYKGQILYTFIERPGSRIYPKPFFYPILTEAKTERDTSLSKNYDVNNGFSPRIIITEYDSTLTGIVTNEADQKRMQEIRESYESVLGVDGSRVLVTFAAERDGRPVEVNSIQNVNLEQLYRYTEESTQKAIEEMFRIPTILYGVAVAGKLGTQNELIFAVKYAQNLVSTSQQFIISILKDIINYSNEGMFESVDVNTLEFKKVSIDEYRENAADIV